MADDAPVTFWPQAAEPQLATQRRPVPHRELLDWKILPTKDEEESTFYIAIFTAAVSLSIHNRTIEWFNQNVAAMKTFCVWRIE